MRSARPIAVFARPWALALFATIAGMCLSACSLWKGGPDISDDVWLQKPPPGAATAASTGMPNSDYVPLACPQSEQQAISSSFSSASQINGCVFAMINLIDVRYQNFENQLYSSTTNTNFGIDLGVLGLSSAGTFASQGTSQILHAISGGLTGVRTTIDTDILYSKTISVVIQQMRTDRANELDIILKRVHAATPADKQAPSQVASQAAETAANMVTSAVNAVPEQATVSKAKQAAQAAADSAKTGAASATAPSTPEPYANMYEAATDLHNYAIAGSWTHALVALESATSSKAEAAKANVNATKTGSTPPKTTSP